MESIIAGLPLLGVAIVINILTGLHNKIEVQHIAFDWKTFFKGIIKAIIVGASFIGLAYIFDSTDLSSVGVTPEFLMNSSILLYTVKGCTNLAEILGVQITKK